MLCGNRTCPSPTPANLPQHFNLVHPLHKCCLYIGLINMCRPSNKYAIFIRIIRVIHCVNTYYMPVYTYLIRIYLSVPYASAQPYLYVKKCIRCGNTTCLPPPPATSRSTSILCTPYINAVYMFRNACFAVTLPVSLLLPDPPMGL
jgi:hypothetical protein